MSDLRWFNVRNLLERRVHHHTLALKKRTKFSDTVLVPFSFKSPSRKPLLLKELNGSICIGSDACIEQIGSTDDTRPSLASMAVHKYPLAFLLRKVLHLLANHKDLLDGGCLEILPVVVEVGDSDVHEALRVVTETDLVVNSIPARRVLARLLQVEYCAHVCPTVPVI